MSSMMRIKSAHEEKISFCPASEGSAQDVSENRPRAQDGCAYHLDRHLRPGDLNAGSVLETRKTGWGMHTKQMQRRAHQTRGHVGAGVQLSFADGRRRERRHSRTRRRCWDDGWASEVSLSRLRGFYPQSTRLRWLQKGIRVCVSTSLPLTLHTHLLIYDWRNRVFLQRPPENASLTPHQTGTTVRSVFE